MKTLLVKITYSDGEVEFAPYDDEFVSEIVRLNSLNVTKMNIEFVEADI